MKRTTLASFLMISMASSISAYASTPLTMDGIPINLPDAQNIKAQDQNMPPIPVSVNDQSSGDPAIGYWMITKDDQVAHWLGDRKVNGKQDSRYTLEPINTIFMVKADSSSDAATKLDHTLRSDQIGFSHLSIIHSDGYKAKIGGKIYKQYNDNTYSDKPSYLQNDHLRIFGPTTTPYKGYYVFTGSCSEETGWFTQKQKEDNPNLIGHHFVSFNHCRDALYNKFKDISASVQYVKIANAYTDANFTTRDHQGNIAQITL